MSNNRYDRKEQRHRDALIRNSVWAAFSPKQQLELLDRANLVAKKQRNKILKKLS